MKKGGNVVVVKRFKGVVLFVTLLLVGLFMSWQIFRTEGTIANTDSLLPYSELLRRVRVTLNYQAGQKEQNNVFIGDNRLMKNLREPQRPATSSNIAGVLAVSEHLNIPSYLMLLPTACAVIQNQVPYSAVAPLYDQRAYLDTVYRQLAGNITVVDVYPTLFNHQQEGIYYRTHHGLTGLGGYYIYSVAAKKLGQPVIRDLEQFTVSHTEHTFYGDLYRTSPYRNVTPDRISLYHYTRSRPGFNMTRYDADGISSRYYEMYVDWKAELDTPLSVLYGGHAPLTDIRANASATGKQLLIFGDESVWSYMPFLITHYGRITVADPTQLNDTLLSKLTLSDYNQVLFACNLDTFLQTNLFEAALPSILGSSQS